MYEIVNELYVSLQLLLYTAPDEDQQWIMSRSCYESIFIPSSKLNTFAVVLVWPLSDILCAANWLLLAEQTNDLTAYSVFISQLWRKQNKQ